LAPVYQELAEVDTFITAVERKKASEKPAFFVRYSEGTVVLS